MLSSFDKIACYAFVALYILINFMSVYTSSLGQKVLLSKSYPISQYFRWNWIHYKQFRFMRHSSCFGRYIHLIIMGHSILFCLSQLLYNWPWIYFSWWQILAIMMVVMQVTNYYSIFLSHFLSSWCICLAPFEFTGLLPYYLDQYVAKYCYVCPLASKNYK